MVRYQLGQMVKILPPFGDGQTMHAITAMQGVNAAGEITEQDAITHQYEVNGTYYAHEFLEA